MRFSKQVQVVAASATLATCVLWAGFGTTASSDAASSHDSTSTRALASSESTAGRDSRAEARQRARPATQPDGVSSTVAIAVAAPARQVSAAERDAPADVQRQQDTGAPERDQRMSRRVAALARAQGERPVEVIVRFDAQQNAIAASQAIRAAGGQVVRTYDNLPVRAVRIAGKSLRRSPR